MKERILLPWKTTWQLELIPGDLAVDDRQHHFYAHHVFFSQQPGIIGKNRHIGKFSRRDRSPRSFLKGGIGGRYGIHLQRIMYWQGLLWGNFPAGLCLSVYCGVDTF